MKISVLGIGLMGAGLAEGLIKAGHEVVVYNRTMSKTEPLIALGAKAVKTPAEAIKESDASILVVSDANVVRSILLNDETKKVLKGKKILNAATTNPIEIVEIAKEVSDLGGDLAEMSILVGHEQLSNREGNFLVGCNAEVELLWNEILNSVGQNTRVGEIGDASKAETPMLIGSMFMGATLAYSAAMAMKLNVPQEVIEKQLSMFVPGVEYFLPNIYARDYSQAMASVNSFIDVAKTAISTAKSLEMDTKVFEDILELYNKAEKLGYGNQDGSSIVEVLLERDK